MSDENPYAPPQPPAEPAGPRVIAVPDRMPGTVIAAIILIGLILVNMLVGPALAASEGERPSTFFPMVVTITVLMGLLMRHPMAWSFSRSLAALASFLLLLAVVFGLLAGDGGALLRLALSVLPSLGLNIAIYVLLSRPSARAWFGLGCPSCGSLYPHAAKWGYRVVRCRECGTLWEPQTGQVKAG